MKTAPKTMPDTYGVRTLMGVHDLYTRLEYAVDSLNIDPPLSKPALKLIVSVPEPRRMGDLADTLDVTKPTFTALADDLEKKGFIERQRDPDDRRAWRIVLTKQGEATRIELMHQANAFVQATTGLADTDLHEFTRLLDLIRETHGNTECPYV